MPMVRHQAVRKKCNVEAARGRDEDRLERAVVGVAVEKTALSGAAVHDVEDHPGREESMASRHDRDDGATDVPPEACPL